MPGEDEQPATYELAEPEPEPNRAGSTLPRRSPVALFGDHDRFCLDCGQNLRGVATPQCPECGRSFNPNDASTFAMGGAAPVGLENGRQILKKVLVVAMLYLPVLLASRLYLPTLWCILLCIYPFWLVAVVIAAMRLIPVGSIDTLWAHVAVGSVLGLAVSLSLLPSEYVAVAGALIGMVAGLFRRHQTVG